MKHLHLGALCAVLSLTLLTTGTASAQQEGRRNRPGQQAGRGRATWDPFAPLSVWLSGVTLSLEQQKKVEELAAKLQTDVQGILTEEQKAQFKQAMSRPQGANARNAGGRGAMFAGLAEELNLTPEQKTKIQPLIESAQQKMQDLMQAARSGNGDRREMMQKIQDLATAFKAKVRPELTPEQQTKLDAWQPARGRRGGGN